MGISMSLNLCHTKCLPQNKERVSLTCYNFSLQRHVTKHIIFQISSTQLCTFTTFDIELKIKKSVTPSGL